MDAEVPVTTRLLAGRYRLGNLLGRGGMAEVYDGHDERLDRPVAVKLLRPDMAANAEIRERFEVEARAAARLSHPNVVGVFDTGEDDGEPFIVMERLPGDTLADRMGNGPLDEQWLRRVAGDVLAALAAAHAAGLVHRDVKPGNILLGADGRAKVADFGIAKSAEVASDLTGTGVLVGTPAYLAPERLDGHPATPRSDLYSVGVVLYEALTGTKPFPGATPVAVAAAVAHHQPTPLREARPGVDPGFAAGVERAMSKDPAARPASAREMAVLLAGAPSAPTVVVPGGGEEADATLVAGPGVAGPAPGLRPAGRRGARPQLRLAPAAAAVAVLLLVALLAVLLAGGGTGGDDERGAVASAIERVAGRVEGAGAQGPEAAERLRTVASQVRAGGGSDDASALVGDVDQWRADGRLTPAAAAEVIAVLDRVPGVDATALTTTTTTPTTTTTTATTTTAPAEDEEKDEEGDDDGDEEKGKGGRGKGRG